MKMEFDVHLPNGMIEMDPATIDLDMACRMTNAWPEEDKPLTYKSDRFPRVIDFDELAAIKPPKGYGIDVDRDIRIVTTSFRGISPGAIHYFCHIDLYGLSLTKDGCLVCGYLGGLKVGRIFNLPRFDVNRIVTAEDLADKYADWDGYNVGDFTHRWYSTKNAIECAKACVRLRFRNYGKIVVDDVGEC